jgi:hypothetical protein
VLRKFQRTSNTKMWGKVAKTATALDNLITVTVNGVTKTRYGHAGLEIPAFVKYLRTFGEAGTVENMKDGMIGDRGITMMFVEYAEGYSGNRYRLGCQLLFSVSNIFLPIYSNFSIPAVFLNIPVITAVICSQ